MLENNQLCSLSTVRPIDFSVDSASRQVGAQSDPALLPNNFVIDLRGHKEALIFAKNGML